MKKNKTNGITFTGKDNKTLIIEKPCIIQPVNIDGVNYIEIIILDEEETGDT